MNYEMFNGNGRHVAGQRFAGIMMIATGIIFMLSMSDFDIFGYSPWILMALLPVLWSLGTAVKHLIEDGRVTLRVIIPLLLAFVPFLFVGLAMMGLNLGQYWWVIAIGMGFWFLVRR